MFFVYFSVRSYNSNNKCSFSFLFIFYNRDKLQNHIMANARIWNARRFICFFFSLRLTWYRKYIGTRIPFVLKYISEFYLNFIWNMKSQPILLFFVFRFNARKKKQKNYWWTLMFGAFCITENQWIFERFIIKYPKTNRIDIRQAFEYLKNFIGRAWFSNEWICGGNNSSNSIGKYKKNCIHFRFSGKCILPAQNFCRIFNK